MTISIKSRKAKARRLQNKIAEDINQTYATEICRPAIMGESGSDIKFYDKLEIDIECKNDEKISVWKAIEQQRMRSPAKWGILIMQKNRTSPILIVDYETLGKAFLRYLLEKYDVEVPQKGDEII